MKANLAASARERAPIGAENGDFEERIAAIVSAPSRHLKILPSIINFPRNTSSGSFASCFPSGVSSSLAVKALTSIRESTARLIFFDDGGSSASNRAASALPS